MYVNNDLNYKKYLKGKKVYIFGCGLQGKKCCFSLEKIDVDVIGFIDNDPNKWGERIVGKDVISLKSYKQSVSEENMIVISTYFTEIKQQLMSEGVYNFITQEQIDFGGEGAGFYDEKYFEWQRTVGEFGGKYKADIFKPYIKKNMRVAEFGCGGGFLLNNIEAKERIGIEINDTARKNAEELGIKCYKFSNELEDESIDLIISTHVLEHVENPLEELRTLYNKLKDGGKIIFHVPNESCEVEYYRSDNNNHLYTWNSLTLGNLFKTAGFFVKSVKTVKEIWPENWDKLEKEISKELFWALDKIRGEANNENVCIIIAEK